MNTEGVGALEEKTVSLARTRTDRASRAIAFCAVILGVVWCVGRLRGCYYDGFRGEEALLLAGRCAIEYYRAYGRPPQRIDELLNDTPVKFFDEGVFIAISGNEKCMPALFEDFRRVRLHPFEPASLGTNTSVVFVSHDRVPKWREQRANAALRSEWLRAIEEVNVRRRGGRPPVGTDH